MAFPDKHQLKFNSNKDAKKLMEAIEKRFRGNTKTNKVQKTLFKQQYENFTCYSSERLDQIHDTLQKLVSQLKIHEVSLSQEDVNLKFLRSTTTQNIAFVSSSNIDSTTKPVSVDASVSAVCAKMPMSFLPNIDADDIEEIDLKWQMAMLTIRVGRFLQRTGRNLRANVPTSLGFDMSKVSVITATGRDILQGSVGLPRIQEGMEVMTRVFKQRRSLPIMLLWPSYLQVLLLKLRFQSSDGYHAVPLPYTGRFMPPKPDLVFTNSPNGDKTGHSAFNVKLSPTEPDQDLSHPIRPSAPIIEDWHVENFIPAATTKPASPKPTSNGKSWNRKACFVCKSLDHLIKDCNYHEKKMAQPTARYHAYRGSPNHYALMNHQNPLRHMVPAVVLTQSKPVPITVVRPVSTVVPKIKVTRPRHSKPIVTKTNSPTRRHINCSPSPKVSNSPPRVTTVKAPVGNPQHALKDKGVIDSGCSRHMTWNISYLSDFEVLNGGYLAFGVSQMCDKKNSVLFIDTECLVLSPGFKLPDESQVLLRVPGERI
nr:hypothetical protein [Tanacetum cinerariifolium]